MQLNYFKSIFDIDYSLYPNLKVIIFDIDNTLASPYIRHPDKDVKEYINKLKEKGYDIFLYSNNIKPRIIKFASALQTKYFDSAKKPFGNELKRFISNGHYNNDELLLIGDQIFTDVLCGKINKIPTILIDPKTNEEGSFIKFKRILEKPFRNKLNNKKPD